MVPGNIGILGMTPQDISNLRAADRIRERFAAEGKKDELHKSDIKRLSSGPQHMQSRGGLLFGDQLI